MSAKSYRVLQRYPYFSVMLFFTFTYVHSTSVKLAPSTASIAKFCIDTLSVDYVISVRIQKTGSKKMFQKLKATLGSACDWTKCPCQNRQHNAPDSFAIEKKHGKRCSSISEGMNCLLTCGSTPRLFWFDAPHADWQDYQTGLRLGNSSNVIFVTQLREPIARVLSEYRQAVYQPVLWDYHAPKNLSLHEFVTSCAVCSPGVENRQTRMLAGVGDQPWNRVYSSGRDMLEQAKQNLARTAWFGLYEKYEESIALLHKTLPSIAENLVPTQTNRNPSDGINSENLLGILHQPHLHAAIDAIHRKNQLDLELYQYARQLFRERQALAAEQPPCFFKMVLLSGLDKYKDEDACWTEMYVESNFIIRRKHDFKHEVQFRVRSPHAESTELRKGQYILAFGAAQILGTLSTRPFLFQLAQLLNMPALPIGFGGGSPAQILDVLQQKSDTGDAVRELVRYSKYIVVQAMSGRSIENSLCRKPSIDLQEKCVLQNGDIVHGDQWWQDFESSHDKSEYSRLLDETRMRWIQQHTQLITELQSMVRETGGQVIFLYTSKCSFQDKDTFCFPQLVQKNWLAPVIHVADKYVEAITESVQAQPVTFELPKNTCGCSVRGDQICGYMPGFSSDCTCGFIRNAYYPTDEEHDMIFGQFKNVFSGSPRM